LNLLILKQRIHYESRMADEVQRMEVSDEI
jgi:hypothetical protein